MKMHMQKKTKQNKTKKKLSIYYHADIPFSQMRNEF